MIKLFRNIRKKLLEKGKTTRYFKYAIGEIILVVIGILIALQINNWNEAKKEQHYANTILKEMHSNLFTDLEIFDFVIPRVEKRKKAIDTVKQILYHYPKTKSLQGIENYWNLNRQFQVSVNNGGYESLKSKGIEIVKNDSLRNAIVYFYERLAPRAINFIHGEDNLFNEDISRLEDNLFRLTIMKRNRNEEIVIQEDDITEEIILNQNFLKILKRHEADNIQKSYRINSLKEKIVGLTKAIEKELALNNINYQSYKKRDSINLK